MSTSAILTGGLGVGEGANPWLMGGLNPPAADTGDQTVDAGVAALVLTGQAGATPQVASCGVASVSFDLRPIPQVGAAGTGSSSTAPSTTTVNEQFYLRWRRAYMRRRKKEKEAAGG